MQKNNIVLMIAVALPWLTPAWAANENVALYGQANVSYDIINTGTSSGLGALPGISSSRVASNSSRIGVQGSSELGSGWEIRAQAEVTLGTDTGASGCQNPDSGTTTTSKWKCLFDRNTFLGLTSTGYGTLLAGRHDTPYKMATRRLDVFADGIADNRSLMGATIPGGANRELSPGVYANPVVKETFDVRLSNLILYMSPSFGGLSVGLGYSNLTESNTYSKQPSGNAVSVAGMYEQEPFYATIAYEDHTTSDKVNMLDTTIKATKLGLGYKLSILYLGLAYEKIRDDFGNANAYDPVVNPCGGMMAGSNCSGHGTLYLSAKFQFTDDNALKIAYTKAGQVGAASTNTSALQFAMGFDHDFNEHTTGYVLYSTLKNDALVRYGLSTASTSGDNSVNSTGSGGAAPTVLSLGMKYSF
ncbi:MAG: porin [Gallionella sp.]